MGQEEAVASGARALFGEKYGDEVRVVAMGNTESGNAMGWSVELCGGTHVARTGDIGLVTVVGEAGVSAGVRRIEAMTGDAARKHLAAESRKLHDLAAMMKVSTADIEARFAQVLDERKRLERELSDTRKKLAMSGGGKAAGAADDAVRQVGDIKLMARAVEGIEIKDLKSLADEGKKQIGSGVVALISVSPEGKASLVVGVTADLVGRFSAVDLVRAGTPVLGGQGGGGKPDMAQGGGPDGAKAADALAAVERALAG
jgi:alanyl-tRNA synthetase